jgi:hypothetical protein
MHRRAKRQKDVCHRLSRLVSVWLLFSIASDVHATCVVLLISPTYIVLGADGKGTINHLEDQKYKRKTTIIEKAYFIQNKIAVAQCGVEGLTDKQGSFYYTLPSFLEDIQSSAAVDITVSQFVGLIERKLPGMFGPFKRSLALGRVDRRELPQPSATLFRMVIAGFEKGHPEAFLIDLPIDWKGLQVQAPIARKVYPNDTKNITAFVCGGDRGVVDLWAGITNPALAEQEQVNPVEYRALLKDMNLSTDAMLTLDRSMLDVDVKSYPNLVGYPLKTLTLNSSAGRIHRFEKQSESEKH